jgi:alpha-tubulin suppressor-like RCC1 family protein
MALWLPWDEYGQCNVSDWTDIVAISAGAWHTVGLKADGSVVATGLDSSEQCDVLGWDNLLVP